MQHRLKKIRTRYMVLRAAANLSQLDTAARAEISYARYWKIEHGYVTPTREERSRLARTFKLTVKAFQATVAA